MNAFKLLVGVQAVLLIAISMWNHHLWVENSALKRKVKSLEEQAGLS